MPRLLLAVIVLVSLAFVGASWRASARAGPGSPAPGTIDTLAGGGTQTGDGIPATDAYLDAPAGIAANADGDVFFSELVTCTIYRVRGGLITVYAGTGTCPTGQPTNIGDGGPATSAVLKRPYGLALDSAGNLYIADTFNCAIRKVAALTSVITTVAGTNSRYCGFAGDGGPATEAMLFNPQGIAVDAGGNIYVADTLNCRVREVSSGIISTIAGTGSCSYGGDGGSANAAGLTEPLGVAVDSDGNVYFMGNCRIREVSAGVINTVAGTGNCYFTDDGPALLTDISPIFLAIDPAGNVYFADDMHCRIRRLKDGAVTTLAGRNYPPITVPFPDCGYSGDGGPALQAQLEETAGVALDGDGNVYFTEFGNYQNAPDGSGHVRVVYHPLDAPATPTFTSTPTASYTPTPTDTPTPTHTPTATPTRAPSCADFDRSGVVTMADIMYVVHHFHSSDLSADLNSDGVVSIADILMALHEYSKAC